MIQTKQSQSHQKQSYPRISFKKCILIDHENTISQLAYNPSQQAKQNQTIRRCLEMHYNCQRHQIFSFLIIAAIIKIGTHIVHLNRSMALSAPRNWRSVLFKYLLIPYFYSISSYTKYMKKSLIQISDNIKEDVAADQIYQPLFEKKYPDINQPFYATPFKKFSIDDVMQQNRKSINIV